LSLFLNYTSHNYIKVYFYFFIEIIFNPGSKPPLNLLYHF